MTLMQSADQQMSTVSPDLERVPWPGAHSTQKPVIHFDCSDAFFRAQLLAAVAPVVDVCEKSPVQVIIDLPVGRFFERLHDIYRPTIVYTPNACQEYLAYLSSLGVLVLNLSDFSRDSLMVSTSLVAAFRGWGKHYTLNAHASALTAFELKLVHHIAMGLSNKKIASVLEVSEGVIKNGVLKVFGKLSVKSRVQVALHYFGHPQGTASRSAAHG